MPVIHIHTQAGRTVAQRQAMLAAVRDAVTEAFSIKDRGLYCTLSEYPPENLLLVEGESEFLHIELVCFSGRTDAQKRFFYRLAHQKLAKAGVHCTDVTFLVHEQPLIHWGIGTGQAACDFFSSIKQEDSIEP